jgi:hypothetical protein
VLVCVGRWAVVLGIRSVNPSMHGYMMVLGRRSGRQRHWHALELSTGETSYVKYFSTKPIACLYRSGVDI